MKFKIFISSAILFSLLVCACVENFKVPEYENNSLKPLSTRIWDKVPHAAFADLIRFNDAFYCSFREGAKHVGANGAIRVIKSVDGIIWESVAHFEIKLSSPEGCDLRDPKFSVTPDNRILLLVDVEYYSGNKRLKFKPHVSFSDSSGENFSALEQCLMYYPDDELNDASNFWVWRLTWDNFGVGYGFDYLHPITLFKTQDGINYHTVTALNLPAKPTETTIRFDKNNRMYALIRKNDSVGVLAISEAPHTEWELIELDYRVEGQNFIFLDDETLCIATRKFEKDRINPQSAVYVTDLKGKIKKEIELVSSGDCGYPGMAVYNNELWITYYSSHEGVASIYLSKIPISELQNN